MFLRAVFDVLGAVLGVGGGGGFFFFFFLFFFFFSFLVEEGEGEILAMALRIPSSFLSLSILPRGGDVFGWGWCGGREVQH